MSELPVRRERSASLGESAIVSLRSANDELREHVAQLKVQLDSEKKNIRKIHRDKVAEVRAVVEDEQRKASAALLELKGKLQKEKERELEAQKENLLQKYEQDVQKLTRQKDAEIAKLKQELDVKDGFLQRVFSQGCKDEMKEQCSDGLKVKLLNDIRELRWSKRQLEESLSSATEADRFKVSDLRRASDSHESELGKFRKDACLEIQRLIDELKSKDKIISQLERQLGRQSTAGNLGLAPLDKGGKQDSLSLLKSAVAGERTHAKEIRTTRGNADSPQIMRKDDGASPTASFLPPIEEGGEKKVQSKMASLETQLTELEQRYAVLEGEKNELVNRLFEAERRSKSVQERSKKYLERSMDLTTTKRSLEDKMKVLTEENSKLKDQSEQSRRKAHHLSRQLSHERLMKEGMEEQTAELDELHKHVMEQNKAITALKQTCSEKDRRIELIQHRKKRRRQDRSQEKLAGVRETYYGYDEDSQSLDSEPSTMSIDNSIDEDTWDEFAREEFEKNYQRLMREHLELEKSYTLLHPHMDMYQDPQRENKARSQLEADLFSAQCRIEELKKIVKLSGKHSKWIDEKRLLAEENVRLTKKVEDFEKQEEKLKAELDEAHERGEELEFKFFELEESQDVSFDKPTSASTPTKASSDVPPVCAMEAILEEARKQDIDFQDLRQQLDEVNSHMDVAGSDQSKLALLKAHAFLDIVDKTLKDKAAWNTGVGSSWLGDSPAPDNKKPCDSTAEQRAVRLEDGGYSLDKADHCTCDSTEVSAQLSHAHKRIVKLETVFQDVSKAVEVYKTKLNMAEQVRVRERSEIEALRSQLLLQARGDSSNGELLRVQLDNLRLVEQRADGLERMVWELQEKVIGLQQDKHALEERLASSDHGRVIILAEDMEVQEQLDKLQEKVTVHEKGETELMEKNLKLEKEIYQSRLINSELSDEVNALQTKLESLRKELNSVKERNVVLESLDTPETIKLNNGDLRHSDNLSHLRAQVEDLQSQLEDKTAELDHVQKLLLNEEILEQIRQLGKEMGVIKEENNSLRSQLRDKESPPQQHNVERMEADIHESKAFTSDKKEYDELCHDLDDARDTIQQLRTKLRLAEDTINDLESSEGELRDNLDATERKENDYRKKISGLQKTIQSLRDQLTDKDFTEEALLQKITFLEDNDRKIYSQISELKSNETSLLHRLHLKEELQNELDLVTSLEEKVAVLKAENSDLQNKVNDLEESEDILKKNWKAVAEEDTGRIVNLEEKVRRLEITNHELKNKLRQDEADAELIDEMHQQSPGRFVSYNSGISKSLSSNLDQLGRLGTHTSPSELGQKVEQLENQLQLVIEEKNSKIESLQERLDVLRETEMKLSETVFEMEQEEKHLRAKLALYENSVVTVENMARYEDKLKEMQSSEQNLLDRMSSLEYRETDLTVTLEETKTEYESKISKLERNICDYQKLEENLLDKIQDLETGKKDLEKKLRQSRGSGKSKTQDLDQITDLKSRVKDLRLQTGSLEKQNLDLRQKTSELENENARTSAKCEEYKKRVSSLEYLEKKVEVLQDAEQKLTERLIELEELNIKLGEDLEKSNHAAAKVGENNSSSRSALFEKNQQLEEENQTLRLQVQRQSKTQLDSEGLREKVTLLEKAEDKLMERVMDLEESEERLLKQLAMAHKSDLQDQLDSTEHQTDNLQQEIRELKEDCEQLTVKLKWSEKSHEEDKLKISILLAAEDNLTVTLTEKQKREMELEEELEAAEEKVEELEDKVVKLQEQIFELSKNVDEAIQRELDTKMEELQTELEETQEKLEELQTEYEQKIEDLEESEAKIRREYDNKIQKLQENEKTVRETIHEETAVKVSALHSKIDDVSAQLEKQLEVNRKRDDSLQTLSTENLDLRKTVQQLKARLPSAQSVISQHTEYSEILRSSDRMDKQPPLDDSVDGEIVESEVIPRTFQSTFSFIFQGANSSAESSINQTNKDKLAFETSETESQSNNNIDNSQELSFEKLFEERETQLQEIEKLRHLLEKQKDEVNRIRTIAIEETSSGFTTKEIVYRAKIDRLQEKLDHDSSHRVRSRKVSDTSLSDEVGELKSREVLYCKKITEMQSNFRQLRESIQYHDSPVVKVPGKTYTEMSQPELVKVVQICSVEQCRLEMNLNELEERFVTFRTAVADITSCLQDEVVDSSSESRQLGKVQKSAELQKKFADLADSEAELRDRLNFLKLTGEYSRSSESSPLSSEAYEEIIMDLREKVDGLQEKESRLKKRLYEKSGISPNAQVRKLYDRIIDLEASESRLQRKVEYLKISEDDLRRRLTVAQCGEIPSNTASGRKVSLEASVLPKRDLQKEELQITLEQLRKNESALQERVREFESCNKEGLVEKVQTLERSEKALKRKIEFLENGKSSEEEESSAMLEKPEDVLNQRIIELERIEKHLRKQVAELEKDREELHEIASKDKTTIHEQNIRLRELQLSEKTLKDQVNKFELSERLLYNKVEGLEDHVEALEDTLREMRLHEVKYQEILQKYKLDGEFQTAKSENMEATVEELSVSELTLKKRVQELEVERCRITGKSEALGKQLKDVEDSKSQLDRHLREAENEKKMLREQMDAVQRLEGSSQQRNDELAKLNVNLSNKIHKLQEDKAGLVYNLSQIQIQVEALERKLGSIRESEMKLKHQVSDLEKSEQGLQKEVKDYRLGEIESQAKVREMEQEMMLLKDKLTKLKHRENTLRYRVQELENTGPGIRPQELDSGREFNSYQERIMTLTRENEDLKVKLESLDIMSVKTNTKNKVEMSRDEFNQLQSRVIFLEQTELHMEDIGKVNVQLRQTVNELEQRKDEKEMELNNMKKKLDEYNHTIQKLQRALSSQMPSKVLVCEAIAGEVTEGVIIPRVDSKRQASVLPRSDVVTSSTTRKAIIADLASTLLQGDSALIANGQDEAEQGEVIQDTMHKSKPQAHNGETTADITKLREDFVNCLPTDDLVIEEEHWQRIESKYPHTIEDSVTQDSHWGRVETAQQLNLSPHRATTTTASRRGEAEEIAVEISLLSEKSQNDTDSSAIEKQPIKTVKLITLRNANNPDQTGAPPPLPSSLPPTLPARVSGPGTDSRESHYITGSVQNSCDSADEVSDFDDDEEAPPLSAKPVTGLGGTCGSSRETTPAGHGTVPLPAEGATLVDKMNHLQRQLEKKDSVGSDYTAAIKWRLQAEEKARQLELSNSENKASKDLINKLEEEVEEKTRYIAILEALLKTMEELLNQKQSKTDKELNKEFAQALKWTKAKVAESHITMDTGVKDNAALHVELLRKDRDLVSKYNEVSSLKRQLREWQDECQTTEEMRVNALDCLRSLEMEVMELQNINGELKDVKEKYNSIKNEHELVQQRCSLLENAVKEKEHCDQENETLRAKLKDYGKVTGELSVLQSRSEVTKQALNERLEAEKQLLQEKEQLRTKMAALEQDLSDQQPKLVELKNSKFRIEELERRKLEAEGEKTTLMAKLAELTERCKEKDELIERLTAELEKMKKEKRIVPDKSSNTESLPQSGGLNGSLSSLDVSFQDDEIVASTHRSMENRALSSGSSNAGDPGTNSFVRPASADPTRRKKRLLPSTRSITPSPMSNGHSSARQRYQSKMTVLLNKPDQSAPSAPLTNGDTFVAIADYNPQLFSRSNRPGSELRLREGDTVTVLGGMDEQGYYEAEVSGHQGLVPANYLLPTPVDTTIIRSMTERRQQQLQRIPDYLDHTPEQILKMHNELHQSVHTSQTANQHPTNGSSHTSVLQLKPQTTQPSRPRTAPPIFSGDCQSAGRRRLPMVNGHRSQDDQSSREMSTRSSQTLPRTNKPIAIQTQFKSLTLPKKKSPVFEGPPSPPTSFAVERVVGDHGLMLNWQTPELDELARSNGSEVSGYQIYYGEHVCKEIHSPHMGKTVIENLDVQKRHRFHIETMAVNGQTSSRVEALFDGDLTGSSFSSDSDTDLSSVLSSVQYDHGLRRAFMAIYDYSPMKHSPHDYTGCELALQAGEIITIFGRLRPDGFYHGEINGKRGLVPASFIEEVPQGKVKINREVLHQV